MDKTASKKRSPRKGSVPSRYLISDLCAYLEKYLEPEEVREVYRAYLFGAEAHEGQHRLTGEPYIYHPLAVARILAEMRMDYKGIMAAILHDVIEDTPTAKDQLTTEFDGEIAELVDGVSKLTQINFRSRAEAQAENFRKMLMAMGRDIRVILIKLADRLHNMRTLDAVSEEKRRRIARETMEIHAPIANRLGMNSLRIELEDLCFHAMYPMRYRVLLNAVKQARGNRKQMLRKIETAIKRRMRQENLTGKVIGREKHLYSIYLKMRSKHLPFSEVFDVYAFRIVVDSVDTCYRALGVMHNLYKPVPGKFKDYVAIPKANGYQSLHSVLFGLHGVPIEVQLRTREMDQLAESGIAAHWIYKLKGTDHFNTQARANKWLHGLLEMQKSAGDSLEFIENVKIDLFADEVYVFTPMGEIMELPSGATVVDFAYAVHSDVGNTCVAARIDRRLAPLRTPLLNGQTVEVVTAPGARPNPAWLNFVVTAKARTNIRGHLKNFRQQEAVDFGRRLLNKELAPYGVSVEQLGGEELKTLLSEFNLLELEGLLEEIGLGKRLATLVVRRIVPDSKSGRSATAHPADRSPLLIKGTEGLVVRLARCCRPIPGDPILGNFSTGSGIVVHHSACKNLTDFRKNPENWIDVEWEPNTEGEFPTEVRVDVANQRGVLATVASAISERGCNVENVSIEERDGLTSALLFTMTVRDRDHLASVIRRIRAIPLVMRITRSRG